MKKKGIIGIAAAALVVIVLAVAAVIVMFAVKPKNSSGDESGTNGEVVIEINDKKNIDDQLKIIADNINMWKLEPDYANEQYSYAVTDLDRNGRLEIIVSNMGGTGRFTYNNFYEVNEKLDGLNKCKTDFSEYDSQPDMIEFNVDMYYDSKTDKRYYIEKDFVKVSVAEYYTAVNAVSLKDGKVDVILIGSQTQLFTESDSTITYKDSADNIITKEEFEKLTDNIYASCSKHRVSFGWQQISNITDADSKAVISMLQISYGSFKID